ncbi:MAG: PEP/pyruvate-binding domain-containing protein [Candidatus Wallbacteria bacterium]|nr:PEP/pyruvate-binding domain-containing protein [Candidatus Wallbacteria bacterium]
MKEHLLEELVKKICCDGGFLKWAIENKGLAVIYLQYKKRGPVKDQLEKKTLLESLSRLLISGNEHCVSLIGELFEYDDLIKIEDRIIGKGKIGGKTTGMLLAYNALRNYGLLEFKLRIPDSWFIGSSVFTDFLIRNGLSRFEHVKFLKDSYEENYREFVDALPITEFDPEIVDKIKGLLDQTSGEPLILRSSSLLEDSFGTPFAGKYESYFLPNAFSPLENLEMFLNAVKHIYSSVYDPNALEYRKKKNLLHEYEAMAILVQKVVGVRLDQPDGRRFFMPLFSGVGFSQNCYPWSDSVRQEDGVLRLALGLGTAVVDVSESERTFMCDLSNFSRPVKEMEEFLKQSQRTIHVLDLDEHNFKQTVKRIKLEDLKGLSSLSGIEEIVSIADRDTGSLSPAYPENFSSGYPFVTFEDIGRWGMRLKEALKVIEFHYSKRHLVQFLNDSKWDTVAEIIRILNESQLDFADDEISLALVEIYHHLKDDTLSGFDTDAIRTYFEKKPEVANDLVNRLQFVVDGKRLLKNLDSYSSFKNCFKTLINMELIRNVNSILARNAMDTEFAVCGEELYLLQCRPLSMYVEFNQDEKMVAIQQDRKFVDAIWPCPNARVEGIETLVYVEDRKYTGLSQDQKYELSKKIGELNRRLKDYFLLLPGRAGSSCPELGVPVSYKSINNARIIAEYPLEQHLPEFSYGSHFYLDLVGDGIYNFAIDKNALFRKELIEGRIKESFFEGALIVAVLPLNVYFSAVERRIICEILN